MHPQHTQPTQKTLYEGKAKILFADSTGNTDSATLIQHFKDDTTAFNGSKHAVIAGKGVLACHISTLLFDALTEAGIPHHFIARLGDRQQRIRHCQIIPLEVVVRNRVAGSLTRLIGSHTTPDFQKGAALNPPLVEYYLKDDTLGDPLINTAHIKALGLASDADLAHITEMTLATNTHLTQLFAGIGIDLVDFKLEFGRPHKATANDPPLMIADEISPDSCRLWDASTGAVMDKDLFRHDLGDLISGYQDIADRLASLSSQTNPPNTKSRASACV